MKLLILLTVLTYYYYHRHILNSELKDSIIQETPEIVPYEEIYAPNEIVRDNVKIICEGLEKPEKPISYGGELYSASFDGFIYKIKVGEKDGKCALERWSFVGGHPIGGEFDENGNLYVCDVLRGLVFVNATSRQPTYISQWIDDAEPHTITFCDDVAYSRKHQKVYFTDASDYVMENKDGGEASVKSFLSGRRVSRLFEYDIATMKTRLMVDKLWFGNGVVVDPKEENLLLSETFGRRVFIIPLNESPSKYPLKMKPFSPVLPTYPDNILLSEDKKSYWVTGGIKLNPDGDMLVQNNPLIRKITYSLPKFLQPPAAPQTILIQLDLAGNVKKVLYDFNGEKLGHIATAKEFNGKLYLGSYKNHFLGELDLKKV